jgi:hypothetical protein
MKGVDLRTVQELAGHKTIAMTVRYAHLAPEHNQAAIERLDPVEIKTRKRSQSGARRAARSKKQDPIAETRQVA